MREHAWLPQLLERNAETAYLRAYGSPRTIADYRANIPLVTYEQLQATWLPRMTSGEADVLFAGRPCAYERTGGSSGGAKLVPYAAEGLDDFRAAIVPWLDATCRRFDITRSVYFSISPATRAPEWIGGVPLGLPDTAYLGEEWGTWLAQSLAVPLHLVAETDVARWRAQTLATLAQARDLELISVWSPTFLLRLLDDLPDPRTMWPRLKVVSCWASASSRGFADELRRRLPHAHLQPKGLLSTECVVTVPDEADRPVLTPHGFFEFECDGALHLAEELEPGAHYEVIATTTSGLYRYRTGDCVRCDGFAERRRPILEFVGRSGIVSDLVGEKLVERFVDQALQEVAGHRFVAPLADGGGYALVLDAATPAVSIASIEEGLAANPQYAYARRMGQLRPLQELRVPALFDRYVAHQVRRGVRVGDVKPLALVLDASWIPDWSTVR